MKLDQLKQDTLAALAKRPELKIVPHEYLCELTTNKKVACCALGASYYDDHDGSPPKNAVGFDDSHVEGWAAHRYDMTNLEVIAFTIGFDLGEPLFNFTDNQMNAFEAGRAFHEELLGREYIDEVL